MSQVSKLKWWQVFALLPIMVGLFALDAHIGVSSRVHQVIQIGIVFVIFGGMALWARMNAPALLKEEGTFRLSLEYDPNENVSNPSDDLLLAAWPDDSIQIHAYDYNLRELRDN